MILKDIALWLKEEGRVADYREGLHRLQLSGIFDLLRRLGAPQIQNFGESLNASAAEAHRAAGYNQALNDLVYFEEYYRGNQEKIDKLGPPDFGGEEIALKRGDLKESDIKRRL